jgi:hypothetical protein
MSCLCFRCIRTYALQVQVRKDDPDQTLAGVEAALRPWALKVFRIRHPVHAGDLIERLQLSR